MNGSIGWYLDLKQHKRLRSFQRLSLLLFIGTFLTKWNATTVCSVYNCDGNYNGQPYTQTVSASIEKYPEDRKRCIEAMLNQRILDSSCIEPIRGTKF